MITKHDIIRMARRVTRRGNGLRDGRLMHPRRDWYIGLSVLVTLVLVGGVWNALTFSRYASLETTLKNSNTGVAQYEHDVINRVLKEFDERNEVFEAAWDAFVPSSPAVIEVADEPENVQNVSELRVE